MCDVLFDGPVGLQTVGRWDDESDVPGSGGGGVREVFQKNNDPGSFRVHLPGFTPDRTCLKMFLREVSASYRTI